MHFRRSFGLVVLSLAAVACGSSSAASEDHSKVTLAGSVGSGSSGTRSFGGISGGSLHVTAHEVFKKDGARGRNVGVSVGGDGRWQVDIARGSRWIVTVDSEDGHSAMVMFGDKDVISVSQNGGESRVDIGDLHVTGGTASSNVTFDGFDLQATLAAADDAILDAEGAILDAQKAVADAEQAAKDAEAQANAAVADAEKQAEEAKKAAGGI